MLVFRWITPAHTLDPADVRPRFATDPLSSTGFPDKIFLSFRFVIVFILPHFAPATVQETTEWTPI